MSAMISGPFELCFQCCNCHNCHQRQSWIAPSVTLCISISTVPAEFIIPSFRPKKTYIEDISESDDIFVVSLNFHTKLCIFLLNDVI